jgi:hypothetical protein
MRSIDDKVAVVDTASWDPTAIEFAIKSGVPKQWFRFHSLGE